MKARLKLQALLTANQFLNANYESHAVLILIVHQDQTETSDAVHENTRVSLFSTVLSRGKQNIAWSVNPYERQHFSRAVVNPKTTRSSGQFFEPSIPSILLLFMFVMFRLRINIVMSSHKKKLKERTAANDPRASICKNNVLFCWRLCKQSRVVLFFLVILGTPILMPWILLEPAGAPAIHRRRPQIRQ